MKQTMTAGAIAGAMQSLAAAPLDAIVTRSSLSEILETADQSLWQYGWQKLKSIGPAGVFAGYSLSFTKEAASYALYFSFFEAVKGAWYRFFVRHWYGDQRDPTSKKPGRIVFPSFVLLAGSLAAIGLQLVQFPLGKLQKIHWIRIEKIDFNAIRAHGEQQAWKVYWETYPKTFHQINKLRIRDAGGSWLRWLYGGFARSTLVSMPSTSIGLLVFEIMRLRYADDVVPVGNDDYEFL
jgi:hypothetical protein